jgi:hypothetical protein
MDTDEEDWVPGIVGLGSQLSIVRSVPRMAGTDDLGADWDDFLLWVANAVAEESLSSDCFPLSGQHRLGRDHRSLVEVNTFDETKNSNPQLS